MKRRKILKNGMLTIAGLTAGGIFPIVKRAIGSSPEPAGITLTFKSAALVEIENEVYRYTPADNGAGPMWCKGSTCIVRIGEKVFATGLETVQEWIPLNNCRWMLFELTVSGWKEIYIDKEGRTREPSPIATFHDGRILVSVNPTLTGLNERNGPASPEIYFFNSSDPGRIPDRILPEWDGTPAFTEHSYRSFAADGSKGELILFQNIGYTHAEWAFRDSFGKWSAHGQLKWPWGADYEKPQPIRICYPNVAIRDRSVYFFGVSDIIEPNAEWREFKKELTGRDWDYDFRRLFITWCDDISTGKFHPWIEVASREETCGWIEPLDLWIAPDGNVHLLWNERAIDERLRDKFFPGEKQSHTLNYAIFHQGKIRTKRSIIVAREGKKDDTPGWARFHVTKDEKLMVICSVRKTDKEGKSQVENQIIELSEKGIPKRKIILELNKPFINFFTSTIRAGSAPSNTIDMYGNVANSRSTLNYARIRLVE